MSSTSGPTATSRAAGRAALPASSRRLDHLVELGVNAIQILPPAEFPGGFSWGYNPSSIFTVETDYGGPDALKQLIRAAHERGLGVICDVVYNHFGNGDAAVWRFDGWHQGDKGGIYYYNDWRDLTPWGHTRPDYGRPEVRQFLRDNALMWLEQYRFDGLRWDATSFIRNVYGGGDPGADLPDGWNLMRWINDEIDSRQPWKVSIAEDMQNNEWLTKPTGAGGAGFDCQWDSEFVHPVRRVLTRIWDQDRDLHAVADAVRHRYNNDCAAARHLHRIPRRGRLHEWQTPAARGHRPWPCRQLVRQEAVDPRGGPGLHRPRHSDDLPGPGAARGRLLA